MRYSITLLAAVAAVKASPFPQAVTAAISPTGAPPPGCTGSKADSFGIAVMNITEPSSAPEKRQVSQIADGQPQAPTAPAVSQIVDGQPQAPVYTMAPVSMIDDGQVQGGMHTMTMAPVTVIPDGQPPAPACTASAVVQISDGQPQASTAAPVNQVGDGQPQASIATPVAEASDAQPQASTSSPADPTPSSDSSDPTLVACKNEGTLELTLNDGILKDAQGRTGYIASNFQFQFDAPPQSGAIYTSGFSLCSNGSLALGGSNVFYQCLSGSFYNLYDRNWAAQCSPVTIEALILQTCD